MTVEGGPRAGKGLVETYFAAEAYLAGLHVVPNYPVHFPDYTPKHWSELVAVFPQVKQRRLHISPPTPLTKIIDPFTFEELWTEGDCFHVRQEFHQELDSSVSGMKRTDFRLHVLDWFAQIGKMQSSFCADTHRFESIDIRIRDGEVVQRVWALHPFHKRGETFSYLIYDRSDMSSAVVDAKEEVMEFLYSCYDTLYRSKRV